MRRARVVLLATVVLFAMFGTTSAAIVAQDGELAGHPLVGSWLLDTNVEDTEDAPSLATFSSDGTYLETDSDGTTGVGVWESTGETTGDMTFRYVDEEGIVIVRASLEVADDGDTVTAEYTIEITDYAGESIGEYGPGMAEGTRAEVEPMGEPDGSLEDLFAAFEEPEATPED